MSSTFHGITPGVAFGKPGPFAALVAAGSTLLTGLVSWWDLDEESGVRADSVIATGNDLTDINTVGYTAGKIGNAASFVSANAEHLYLASSPIAVSSGDTYTFAGWVKPAAGKYCGIIRVDFYAILQAGAVGTSLFVTGYSYDGAAAKSVSAYTGIPHGNWIFLVSEITQPGTVKLWYNGDNLIGESASLASFLAPNHMHINEKDNGQKGDGEVDLVGIWNRVLTADERTELYNLGAGKDYPF